MLQTDNSIRGKVMRELIARVASDNLIGRKLKSGELRKKDDGAGVESAGVLQSARD